MNRDLLWMHWMVRDAVGKLDGFADEREAREALAEELCQQRDASHEEWHENMHGIYLLQVCARVVDGRIEELPTASGAVLTAFEAVEDAAYSCQDWHGTHLGGALAALRAALGLAP